LLVFHAYINEIHGSRSKIPSKKSRPYIYIRRWISGFTGSSIHTHTHTHTHIYIYIYDISRLRVNMLPLQCQVNFDPSCVHTVVQNMWHECTRKRNGWFRLGLSQVPICSPIYLAIVGLSGLPLFFQVILRPSEWELLLNLQEGIDDRRKGSRDSHLYPETSPISVRGTSKAGQLRTTLKESSCLPSNNRQQSCVSIQTFTCFHASFPSTI
jgi:hypothetical protein